MSRTRIQRRPQAKRWAGKTASARRHRHQRPALGGGQHAVEDLRETHLARLARQRPAVA
ncbi:hypothetical protein [Streptomyces thinghirensis]|uniref:hypothetical protein n=1 Tax=Streptomyces thinghirensis TaxID=551547 RepID=UPI0031E91123